MSIAIRMHKQHIRGTQKQAIVADKVVFFCHLTNKVEKATELTKQVYLKTRVLKHLYDKRTAQEYDLIISNLHELVKFPDYVYKNKTAKRGEVCFTKIIEGRTYLCSLEQKEDQVFIVTAFKVKKESYLKDYTILWSRRSDIPSS